MKKIFRSREDRVLGGVCGGIADYFDLDPTLVRVVWIFFTLFGGSGILAYVIALMIIPDQAKIEKSESKIDTRSSDKSLWAILLIIVGVVMLFQHGDIMGIVWHRFWGSGLNLIFSFLLIGLGIFMLYTKRSGIAASIAEGVENLPLHLSKTDRKLAGVCGGISESLSIDPVIVRFLWIFGTIMSAGIGILLYIVLAVILPEENSFRKEINHGP